jgi:hypothetical protein
LLIGLECYEENEQYRIQDERKQGFIELRPGCTTRPDTEVFRHSVHPDTVQAGEELVSGSSLKKTHIKKIDPGANPKKTFYGRNIRTVIISGSIYHWQAFPALSDVCR